MQSFNVFSGKNAKKITKRVQWKQSCKLRYFEMPTIEDINNSWYDEDDYSNFKAERKMARELVTELGEEAIEDFGRVTCRGIEHILSKPRADEIETNRTEGLKAVCVLQRQLRLHALEDPKMIAEAYSEVSRRAHIAAHTRAVAYWSEQGIPEKRLKVSKGAAFKTNFREFRQKLSLRRPNTAVSSATPVLIRG